MVAVREHVIESPADLREFLRGHELHVLHGQEHAHLLSDYLNAFADCGLRRVAVLGPYDSVINYYPMSLSDWCDAVRAPLRRWVGWRASGVIASPTYALGRWMLLHLARRLSRTTKTPGMLYSFILENV